MSRFRVLLVDDEKLVLSSLRRLLGRAEFDVLTATSGPEALALLEKEAVDLILSDYMMPGMNGVQFLEKVAPRWPAVRRCMLTAQADPETLENALATGLLQHAWTKPWNNQQLIQDLKTALGMQSTAST